MMVCPIDVDTPAWPGVGLASCVCVPVLQSWLPPPKIVPPAPHELSISPPATTASNREAKIGLQSIFLILREKGVTFIVTAIFTGKVPQLKGCSTSGSKNDSPSWNPNHIFTAFSKKGGPHYGNLYRFRLCADALAQRVQSNDGPLWVARLVQNLGFRP